MRREHAPPLRTVLFAPGDDADRIEEAWAARPDAVMLDLEEPRTPFPEREREKARAVVRSFLDEIGDGDEHRPLVFARVQAPSSGETLKDLRAAMAPALTGVLLPKIYGPADVHALDALLTCMEVDTGLPRGETVIYPILETAQALRLAYEIAIASPRVAYMGGAVSRFGDIHQAVGYRWTAQGRETLFLRSKVLIDARAAGIRYPISGMWGGGRGDVEGLRAWATDLRDLGYFGMTLGDPVHVSLVQEVFTPNDEEVRYWRELDRLASEAEAAAKAGGPSEAGRIVHGDPEQGEAHVVHLAHVGSARKNLEWARDLGIIPRG